MALLGRRDEAVNALHATQDAFSRLPATVTAGNSTIANWTEHRLRHTESFVHSFSGTAREAQRAHDDALALYTPARAISRAQVQMHRAVSVVRERDVRAGARHAHAVLDSLPASARGNFVLALADAVLTSVPASDQHRPDVMEYRELVGSVRRARAGSDG